MHVPPRTPSRRTLVLLLSVFLASWLSACDSADPSDGDGAPLTDVIAAVTIEGSEAGFVSDAFPDAGDTTAPTVAGSDEIVRGGSILLTIEAPEGAERLLLGLSEDYSGYYSAAVSSQAVNLVVTSEPDSDLGAFTLLIATEADGVVSAPARYDVTVNTQAGTSGQLQVSLNWDAPVDLDLHLETPNEEDIYYGDTTGEDGGELDLDSNAGCSLDRVDNENISWGDAEPPSGEYVVRVDLWSACDVTDPIPFVVTVNRGGTVSTYTGTFQPDEADQGSAFDGRTITTFTF